MERNLNYFLIWWYQCDMPKTFVSKMCRNGIFDRSHKIFFLICQITICWKFVTCAICRNVVFNDANIVLMTCNDHSTSEGMRAVASTEQLSGREAGVVFLLLWRLDKFSTNREFFVRSVKAILFCAICQNYTFLSTNCDLTHGELTNLYPPILFTCCFSQLLKLSNIDQWYAR